MPWPKGRKHTPEERAALARAWESPEYRARISAARKGQPMPWMVGNRHVLDAPTKGECAYCFAPATTLDHVIPRGRPGWDHPDNIVPACFWCNRSKGNRTPEEWFAKMTNG